MIKKIISIFLVVLFIFLLSSCGTTTKNNLNENATDYQDAINGVLMVAGYGDCITLTLSTIDDDYYLTQIDNDESTIQGTSIISPALNLHKGDTVVGTIVVVDPTCPSIEEINEPFIAENYDREEILSHYSSYSEPLNDGFFEYTLIDDTELCSSIRYTLYIGGIVLYPVIDLRPEYCDYNLIDDINSALSWTYTTPYDDIEVPEIDSSTEYYSAWLTTEYYSFNEITMAGEMKKTNPNEGYVYSIQIEDDKLVVCGSLLYSSENSNEPKLLKDEKRTFKLAENVDLGLDWVGDKQAQIEYFNEGLTGQSLSLCIENGNVVSIISAG